MDLHRSITGSTSPTSGVISLAPPQPEQVKQLAVLYGLEVEHYRKDKEAALTLATDPLGPLPQGTDAADLAAWTVVGNVLLNLDSVLTKG